MANITVVGAGGVGAQTLLELSNASTRHTINVIDRDVVEESGLARQRLYTKSDVGKLKAHAAQERLGVHGIDAHLNEDNADELLKGADAVLDCTDNWQTRCAMNAWALKTKKPWVFTSAIRDESMATTLAPQTPCFVCWNPEPKTPRSCRIEGIREETTRIAAQTQVQELRQLLQKKPRLAGVLQYTNATTKTCATTRIKKNPNCPACVKKTFQTPKTNAALLCGDGEYLFETGVSFTKDALSSLNPKPFGDVMKIRFRKGELVVFSTGRILSRGLSQRQAEAAVEHIKQKQEN
ncbi:ThiF family adenylyltransferase [Candidatus Micrarchaeota archaeon]|nr:ThiF family adenylyltransferase [Candidatus Micrarchaeota archaeon]